MWPYHGLGLTTLCFSTAIRCFSPGPRTISPKYGGTSHQSSLEALSFPGSPSRGGYKHRSIHSSISAKKDTHMCVRYGSRLHRKTTVALLAASIALRQQHRQAVAAHLPFRTEESVPRLDKKLYPDSHVAGRYLVCISSKHSGSNTPPQEVRPARGRRRPAPCRVSTPETASD